VSTSVGDRRSGEGGWEGCDCGSDKKVEDGMEEISVVDECGSDDSVEVNVEVVDEEDTEGVVKVEVDVRCVVVCVSSSESSSSRGE
jgi:hypothetical protein